MTLLDDLLACWSQPVDERADPQADFAAVYSDPTTVNGAQLTVADFVTRARNLQSAFSDLTMEVAHRLEQPDVIVVGFTMTGRHTGTYQSPLGPVEPTGRTVTTRATDILTIVDRRVADIWVIADELSLLTQMGAVSR